MMTMKKKDIFKPDKCSHPVCKRILQVLGRQTHLSCHTTHFKRQQSPVVMGLLHPGSIWRADHGTVQPQHGGAAPKHGQCSRGGGGTAALPELVFLAATATRAP